MSLIAKDYVKKYEIAPAGLAIARCFRVVDLGWQRNQFGAHYEIAIAWELMDKRMRDGRPYVVQREYHHSYHESATLFKHLCQWRGKNLTDEELDCFNLSCLIGKTCRIYVEHVISKKTGTKRAVVQSLSPLPANLACPPAVNPPLVFSLDEATEAHYQALPEYLKKKISWPLIEMTQVQPSDYTAIPSQPIPTFNPAIEDASEKMEFDEDVPF